MLRFVSIALSVLALIIAVPLVALSFYNHPSPADDYCFADTTLRHGPWQAQLIYYNGWSGRFFHNFLVHNSPLAYGWYGGYKVYPIVLLIFLLGAFYALAHEWVVEPRLRLAVAAGLFVGFMGPLQGIPEFMYWYAGMACYSLSVVLFLLLLAVLIAHQRRGFGLIARFVVAESVLVVGIIGSSETSMVMVMSVLALIAWGELLQRRRVSATILLLLGVGAISCYYLISAPGNFVRMGANPNASKIGLTVVSSLRYFVGYALEVLLRTPLLPLSLVYIPVAWRLTTGPLPAYLRLSPLWAILHGLITVFTLISLHFYGVGIPPIPRLLNIINLMVLLSWFYSLTLLVARTRSLWSPGRFRALALPIAVVTVLLVTGVLVRGVLLPTVYGDWLSGRAAAYDEAMQQRYAQLRASAGSERTVPPLPFYPVSLFLEDIKDKPEHLWNRCLAEYYKNKAIILSSK